MITTDIMCTNSVVAAAAGGGGGSRTIVKRGQKAHFLVQVTENKKTWVLGAVQVLSRAIPRFRFLCDIIFRNKSICTFHVSPVDLARGHSTRKSKTRFLHKSLI